MSAGARCLAAAACAAVLPLSGCAGAQDDAAERAAEAFYAAVAAGEGAAACAALAAPTREELEQSSGKPCEQAVLEEDVPEVGGPVDVQVFGVMAEVTYEADRAFLSRYADGWRVVAAACRTDRSGRYDCLVKGD